MGTTSPCGDKQCSLPIIDCEGLLSNPSQRRKGGPAQGTAASPEARDVQGGFQDRGAMGGEAEPRPQNCTTKQGGQASQCPGWPSLCHARCRPQAVLRKAPSWSEKGLLGAATGLFGSVCQTQSRLRGPRRRHSPGRRASLHLVAEPRDPKEKHQHILKNAIRAGIQQACPPSSALCHLLPHLSPPPPAPTPRP